MLDIWRIHQLFGIMALTFFFVSLCRKKFGPFFLVCLLYTLVSALILFQSPGSFWGNLQIRIDATSANSFGVTLLIVASLALMKNYQVFQLLNVVGWVAILNSAIVIVNGFGIFNSSSADCSFIAMTLPFILLRMRFDGSSFVRLFAVSSVVLPLVAIIKSQGSTPYFILCGALLPFIVKAKPKLVLSLISFCVFVGYLTQGSELIDNNGRLPQWIKFMTWHSENASFWLGTGTGSFQWLGPAIQGTEKNLFLFMHNEYLQAFFEQGFIGLILYGLASIEVVKKSWSRPWLVSSFAAIAVCMLTQFPFRYFVSQLFILALFRAAFSEETSK